MSAKITDEMRMFALVAICSASKSLLTINPEIDDGYTKGQMIEHNRALDEIRFQVGRIDAAIRAKEGG